MCCGGALLWRSPFFCALFGSFFCWIILYGYYLVYLQSKYDKIIMTMTKVIHVHLIIPKKNYYFGSITAIYTKLSEKEVGMTKNSLLHAGLSDGGCRIPGGIVDAYGVTVVVFEDFADGVFRLVDHAEQLIDVVGDQCSRGFVDQQFGVFRYEAECGNQGAR